MSRLILIRHAEVEATWHSRCYGRTDVELSAAGHEQSLELAEELANDLAAISEPLLVMASDLKRARILGEAIARRSGSNLVLCPELRERDFGVWEGRSWDDIYAETGDAMNGMLDEPDSWRPAGGETTYEVRDRVLTWYRGLPADSLTVAASHGGPIATLRGVLAGLPVHDWPRLIPAWGETVRLP
ncbi:MAG: histidine phosphatase family protein [Acidobacteriota bacterium]